MSIYVIKLEQVVNVQISYISKQLGFLRSSLWLMKEKNWLKELLHMIVWHQLQQQSSTHGWPWQTVREECSIVYSVMGPLEDNTSRLGWCPARCGRCSEPACYKRCCFFSLPPLSHSSPRGGNDLAPLSIVPNNPHTCVLLPISATLASVDLEVLLSNRGLFLPVDRKWFS